MYIYICYYIHVQKEIDIDIRINKYIVERPIANAHPPGQSILPAPRAANLPAKLPGRLPVGPGG